MTGILRGLGLPLVAAALAFASPALAQSGSAAPAGPTLSASSSALRAPAPAQEAADASATAETLLQQRRAFGQAEALMVIGAAAFLAGAIIGGDAGTIVMLGGAGIGLYGLYLYLN